MDVNCIVSWQVPLGCLLREGSESLQGGQSSTREPAASAKVSHEAPHNSGTASTLNAARGACSFAGGTAVCYGILWMLSDLSLRDIPEHACGTWMQWCGLTAGLDCRAASQLSLHLERGSPRHWAVENAGFALLVSLLANRDDIMA